MPRGGRREGAGRPRKDRTTQAFFDDAESYLEAVVKGLTPPDAVRVTAARALIQYQKVKQRAPIPSLPPLKLHNKEISGIERAKCLEFEEKAALIRAKLKKGRE